MKLACAHCRAEFECCAGRANRASRINAPLYCGKTCAGLGRRSGKTAEQKKAEKAAYDKEYRLRDFESKRIAKASYYQATRDPVKEAEMRKKRMPQHVEYCRRPEYRAYKADYDRQRTASEYGDFAETFLLLLDVEKEIRSQASAYERRVANGYYTRTAQKRRRELWLTKQKS